MFEVLSIQLELETSWTLKDSHSLHIQEMSRPHGMLSMQKLFTIYKNVGTLLQQLCREHAPLRRNKSVTFI
jgi:hypothetical protein